MSHVLGALRVADFLHIPPLLAAFSYEVANRIRGMGNKADVLKALGTK
jgi:hypothetical protein